MDTRKHSNGIFQVSTRLFLSEMEFWAFQREKEGKKRVKNQYFLKIPTDPDSLHQMDTRKHLNGIFQVSAHLFLSEVEFWDFQREKEGKKRVKFQCFRKISTDPDSLH